MVIISHNIDIITYETPIHNHLNLNIGINYVLIDKISVNTISNIINVKS